MTTLDKKVENFSNKLGAVVNAAYAESLSDSDCYHNLRNGLIALARECAMFKGSVPLWFFEGAHDIAQEHSSWRGENTLAQIDKWARLVLRLRGAYLLHPLHLEP